MNELVTISKIEQAKTLIHGVKTLDEIKQIVDQSAALSAYARAHRMSQETRNEVDALETFAFRKMGEISSALEKAKPGKKANELSNEPLPNSKLETLAKLGITKMEASRAEKLAESYPDEAKFNELLESKKSAGDKISRNALLEELTAPKPHVAQNSGNNEWYTPAEYIESARIVMGSIDYDPASSDEANKVVQAKSYDTAETDGLKADWIGNIWLNPPYAGELIPLFINKLRAETEKRNVTSAIVLVNNATETSWFYTLIKIASAVVFPKSRVKFYMPDGSTGAPLQGQAVVYIGNDADRFVQKFRYFGWVAWLKEE